MHPRPYQIEAIKFMLANPRCFNLSEPRTGKTATALWGLAELRKRKQGLTCLIVAPKSTINFTWRAELAKLGMDETGITLINYAWLHRLDSYDYDVVIIDEFTYLKNPHSVRGKAFQKLKCSYLWVLSGTPVVQSAMDSYLMIAAINPASITGKNCKLYSYETVKQRLYYEPYPRVFKPKPDLTTIMAKLITPSFRISMAQTGIDVEATHKELLHVTLTPRQLAALDRLKEDCTIAIAETGYEAVFLNKAVWVSKAVQICSGFNYLPGTIVEYGSNKFEAIASLLETHANDKVIIFSSFTHVVQMMYKKYPYAKTVFGATSDKARVTAFDAFQTGDLQLLIMNPKACSHGLTLSSGDVIIWIDPAPAETYQQANLRIVRPTRCRPQYIYTLWSTMFDRKGYDTAYSKARLQDELFSLLTT